MPRYFFPLRHGKQTLKDPTGTVFPDPAAARREALLIARDFVDRTSGLVHPAWEGWWIDVQNGRRQSLMSMPLATAGPEGLGGRRLSGARVADEGRDGYGQVLALGPVRCDTRPPLDRELDNRMASLLLRESALRDQYRFVRRVLEYRVAVGRKLVAQSRTAVAASRAQRAARGALI